MGESGFSVELFIISLLLIFGHGFQLRTSKWENILLLGFLQLFSIIAMLLWFSLLKEDPVKVNNFLFLTPIFGYALSAIFLGETISIFHYIGALFVMVGTVYSQTNMIGLKRKDSKVPVTAKIGAEADDQRAT